MKFISKNEEDICFFIQMFLECVFFLTLFLLLCFSIGYTMIIYVEPFTVFNVLKEIEYSYFFNMSLIVGGAFVIPIILLVKLYSFVKARA